MTIDAGLPSPARLEAFSDGVIAIAITLLVYDVESSNHASTYRYPRGLPALSTKLGKLKRGYATTGSLAAQHFSPVAPTRLAAVYVKDAVKWQTGDGASSSPRTTRPPRMTLLRRATRRDARYPRPCLHLPSARDRSKACPLRRSPALTRAPGQEGHS